jgi:hypothetical protein
MKIPVKLRPSSHSSDYSVVADCKMSETAERLQAKLREIIEQDSKNSKSDWEYPEVVQIQNRVVFTVYTNDESLIKSVINAVEAETEKSMVEYGYQEFYLTLTLPKKATTATMPLLFSDETITLIRFLKRTCKITRQTDGEGNETSTFHYAGEPIYGEQSNEIDVHHPDKTIKLAPHWTIRIVYDSTKRWSRNSI